MITYILLALCVLANQANAGHITPRIVGGEEVVPHSIPYQVELEFFQDRGAWYCGGALISQNYALTALDCSLHWPSNATLVYVTLGAHNMFIDEPTQINFYSDQIIRTPNDSYYGMTLIKFPSPISYTDAIQPVALPKRSDINKSYVGKAAKYSGWGWTEFDYVHRMVDNLRYANTTIIKREDCEWYRVDAADPLLCSSDENPDGDEDKGVSFCIDERGGPLTVDGVLVGIMNESPYGCMTVETATHVRVDAYLDWIEENSDVVIE